MQFTSTTAAASLLALLSGSALAAPVAQQTQGESPVYTIQGFQAYAEPNSIYNNFLFNVSYVQSGSFAHSNIISTSCHASITTSTNPGALPVTPLEDCLNPDIKFAFTTAEQNGRKGYDLKIQDCDGFTGETFFGADQVVDNGHHGPSDACCSLNAAPEFTTPRAPGQIQLP